MNDKITWVMVPKDLDAFMMYAACEAAPKLSLVSIKNVYQAILAAAPTPLVQDALSTDPASRLIDDVMQLNANLHASNEALMCDVLDMRAVMQRMVAGITHLAEIARQWEPDHSSGADRRGWLLALEAADDAKALLDAQAKRLLIPKSQEASK